MKYRMHWKRHEADMYGTLRVWRRGSLLFTVIMSREDALELAVDLGCSRIDEDAPTEGKAV